MCSHRQTGWWLAGLIALAAGSQTLVAENPRMLLAANRGMVKPPKFDNDVVDLFAADGRTKIGPGNRRAKRATGRNGRRGGGRANAAEQPGQPVRLPGRS